MCLVATRRTSIGALVGLGLSLGLLADGPAAAGLTSDAQAAAALANTTALIARHAEEPEDGYGLAPAGERLSKAYAGDVKKFEFGGTKVDIDALVAASYTAKSGRARLGVEPLAKASGPALRAPFAEGRGCEEPRDRTTLIGRHDSHIPNLLTTPGADPATLICASAWPSSVCGEAMALRDAAAGRLVLSGLVHEPRAWTGKPDFAVKMRDIRLT